MKKLILLLALASPAFAATPPPLATWTLPTLNTDGSSIPASGPGSLVSVRIEYGSCSGAAFGTKAGEVVVALPTASKSFTNLTAPGVYCFQMYVMNTYNVESDVSNVATKTIAPTKPGTGVLTVTKNVFQKHGGDILFVGTVALKTPCGADAHCKAPSGAELYYIPRKVVTFTQRDNGGQALGVCA